MTAASDSIFLVRHGEVHNPDHVVYADLPGFTLSATGRRQAAGVAGHVPPTALVVTSPLERAIETATIIASLNGGSVVVDEALTEWGLGSRWAGRVWDDLDRSFPGELHAYLDHPDDLPFSPESLSDLAERVAGAVRAHTRDGSGPVIFVSHQDPIQAARLALGGRPLADLHRYKPKHCEAIEFESRGGGVWIESGTWAPDQEDVLPPPL